MKEKMLYTMIIFLAAVISARSQSAPTPMKDSHQITTRYLAGWELDFKNESDLTKFLLTHGVDKEGFQIFLEMQSAIKLEIRNDTILYAYRVGEYQANAFIRKPYIMHEYIDSNIRLPIQDWPNHKVFFLKKDAAGTHVIGGNKPKEFTLPQHDSLKTPFTFIGTIDGTTPEFQWLGVEKLHISFPMYHCNLGVYLDYSDPTKPTVLEPVTFSDHWFEEEMTGLGNITFKEMHFKAADYEIGDENVNFVQCGVPVWYQAPEIPVCPKTGEVMKFVCTIPSDREITINEPEIAMKLPFRPTHLSFADAGHLFIFYHPQSKILYATWQW